MKELNITINFDMDGTIADLYGVENWLEYLINGDAFPYAKVRQENIAGNSKNVRVNVWERLGMFE